MKILIACITYEGHALHLNKFLESIKNLDDKADLIFIDNSDDENYSRILSGFKSIKSSSKGTRIGRIISARNKARKYFLDNNYDALMFVDADIVLPKDAIQNLIKCESDIASGVYLGNQEVESGHAILPVLYKKINSNQVKILNVPEIIPDKIIDIDVCGMGCCLIKRNVLEKIKFRKLDENNEKGGEDTAFCIDAEDSGFSIKANTAVKCGHISRTEDGKYITLRVGTPE